MPLQSLINSKKAALAPKTRMDSFRVIELLVNTLSMIFNHPRFKMKISEELFTKLVLRLYTPLFPLVNYTDQVWETVKDI